MAKKKAESERMPITTPRDPDVCFVLFPSAHLTASGAAVSLQSLLNQVQQQPAQRSIQSIEYAEKDRRITIRFEPESKEGFSDGQNV